MDNDYQAPAFEVLLRDGKEFNCAGTSEDSVRLKKLIVNFHHFISNAHSRNQFPAADLRDLCVAIRLFAIENIDSSGRKTLAEQLLIGENNTISPREKFIYLSKLYSFLMKNKGIAPEWLRQIEDSLQKAFYKCATEVDKLLKATPTESALDSRLEVLDTLYKETKKPGAKVNEERLFFAELGVCIKKALESIPNENKTDVTDYCFGRKWQIKMGALIFFMSYIKEGKHPYHFPWFWSPYNHSTLYKICHDTLSQLDDHVRYICLAAFRNFINDFSFRQKLREVAQEKFPNNSRMAYIDASLVGYERFLTDKLNAMDGIGETSFPRWALIFGILGALAMGPLGRGVGVAAGTVFAQTDTFVPLFRWMSSPTRTLMHLGMGEAGRNMAYKASELVTMNILSYGLGTTCQAITMAVGGTMGFVAGTAVDLSIDVLGKLRKDFNIPAIVSDKDLSFVLCLMNLPPNILAQEKKDRIKYKTRGMRALEGLIEEPAASAQHSPGYIK